MTPKEKAEEILNIFKGTHVLLVRNTKGELSTPYSSGFMSNQVYLKQTKESAISCVDVILNDVVSKDYGVNYWEEVKKELEYIKI